MEREEQIELAIARLSRMGLPITSVEQGIVTIDFKVLLQFPCEIYASYEAAVAASRRNSAALGLLKVESGINGLLPTSWVPSIYSVSLLIRLRYALEEVTVFCVRPLCARSSRPSSQTQNKSV